MRRRLSVVTALLLLLLAAGCVEIPGCGYGVDFSPDGKQLAFTWMSKNGLYLAIADVNGKRLHVVPHSENPGPPLWSPDGKYLVFTSDTDLTLYDLAQHLERRIATQVVPGAYVWNGDGTQIICISAPASKSNDPPAQVLWIAVPSGEVVFRADLPADVEPPGVVLARATVAYLPATWGIAFIGSEGNVYTVEAGKVYRVTSTKDVQSLWVSPDGSRLRWVRSPQNSKILAIHDYDLGLRTVTGKPMRVNLQHLSPMRGFTVGGAVGILSPDGQKMLLLAEFKRGTGKKEQSYSAVYLVDPDRHEFRLLLQQDPSRTEEKETSMLPFWSRDGSRIAVLTLGKTCSLWVSRGDGSGGRVIRHMKME